MALKDYSATAGNNTSVGGVTLDGAVMTVSQVDNAIRALMADIAAQGVHRVDFEGADIASATTTNLANATGWSLDITGTTTITGFGTVDAGQVFILRFAGALTLTHNATSLILPGGANITTAANDVAVMKSEGSGNWRCISYQRASGSLFLPSGAVIDFNSGDVNITHSSNLLALLGGGLIFGKSAAGVTDEGVEIEVSSGLVSITREGAAGLHLYRRTDNGTVALFHRDSSLVGSISVTTNATTYNTSSDGRLKPLREDFDSGALIDALTPVRHNWLHEPGTWSYGLIAQDDAHVVPQAVLPGSEAGPGDDGFVPWGVDYSKYVPILIRELKRLRARVAALES